MNDCPRCGAAKHKGRCKAENLKKVQRTNADSQPAPAPVTLAGSLEVPAGLGFRASLEDGQLCIEQDRSDGEEVYTHSIALSPSEARQLIDFIAERVAA